MGADDLRAEGERMGVAFDAGAKSARRYGEAVELFKARMREVRMGLRSLSRPSKGKRRHIRRQKAAERGRG